jgi:hypothetical protein
MTNIDLRTLTQRHLALRPVGRTDNGFLLCIAIRCTKNGVRVTVVNGGYYAELKADGSLIVEDSRATSDDKTYNAGAHEVIWQGQIPNILTRDYRDAMIDINQQILDGKSGLVAYDDMPVPVRRGAITDLVARIRTGNLSADTEALLHELSRSAS